MVNEYFLIKGLKSACDLSHNEDKILINKDDLVRVLDYVVRLENIKASQEALIDHIALSVKCSACPVIETCNYKEPTRDCQFKEMKVE